MGSAFSICLGDLYPSSKESSSKAVVENAEVLSNIVITPRCCFGASCYWGTEKYLKNDFVTKTTVDGSITNGAVGFMGPKSAKKNPNYEEVCRGKTGHVEVFDCEFTGGAPYYEAMVRFFFQFHDPTTMDKQGNDAGTQYASVIYCYDKEQMRIANKVKSEVQRLLDSNSLTCYQNSDVTTDIRMVESDFFPALETHQNYLEKNPRVRIIFLTEHCNTKIQVLTKT